MPGGFRAGRQAESDAIILPFIPLSHGIFAKPLSLTQTFWRELGNENDGSVPMTQPLRRQLAAPAQLAALLADERQHLLGGMVMGDGVRIPAGAAPMQQLAAPLLEAAQAGLCDLWFSAAPCRFEVAEGIRFGCDEQLLYGVLEVDEAAALQLAAEDAYRRIFALLDRLGYCHLWRTWNYLARINEAEQGLERYRQFNIGRHQAFAASGRLTRGAVPAASALGVAGGPLSIAFMAGREAPRSLENPRQMAAYEYPQGYGPRSPTFSRATLARLPGQELLFVSGTASILGHATVHGGDVVAQTTETVANLAAVVEEANRCSAPGVGAWRLDDLAYRAYVRHAADLGAVRDVLRKSLDSATEVVFVQADICRADLLVEVEAFGMRTPRAELPG